MLSESATIGIISCGHFNIYLKDNIQNEKKLCEDSVNDSTINEIKPFLINIL